MEKNQNIKRNILFGCSIIAIFVMLSILPIGINTNQSNIPRSAVNANPATPNLGSAENFVLLSKSGISTTGTTTIIGNIGVSPADSTYITGFDLTIDISNTYSTSALVIGNIYASDYIDPTPSIMTTAISDLHACYVDVAGRSYDTTSSVSGADLAGLTFHRGVYQYTAGVVITNNMYINGSATDIVIFQISGTLTVSSAVNIILLGQMLPKNIYWQVTGTTHLGTTSVMKGILLDATNIQMDTGATLIGRGYSETAITLDANAISIPIPDTISPVAPHLNAITPSPNINGTIDLTWNNIVGATVYIVLRYNSSITLGNYLLATTISNTTSVNHYRDSNRPNGIYYYAIRSSNATGNSSISNSVGILVNIPITTTTTTSTTTDTSSTTDTTSTTTPTPEVNPNLYWIIPLMIIGIIGIIGTAFSDYKKKNK